MPDPTDCPPPLAPGKRPRRTQTERREEAEQRMLDAALTLVAEKGSFRITLAEIGEHAGYSRGLPAHHFGSKDKLLAALARHIHERFALHRQSYVAAPGLPAIEAVIHAYFTRADAGWTTTRALIVMMAESTLRSSELGPMMASYNRESQRYLKHHIEQARQLGQTPADVDPHTLAVVLLATFRGVMLQALNDPDIALDRVRDEVLRMMRLRLQAGSTPASWASPSSEAPASPAPATPETAADKPAKPAASKRPRPSRRGTDGA